MLFLTYILIVKLIVVYVYGTMCYVFVHLHEKWLFPQLNYIKAKLSCNEWYMSTLIKNPDPLSFLVLNKEMSLITGKLQLPR